jgi:hypothetical protein
MFRNTFAPLSIALILMLGPVSTGMAGLFWVGTGSNASSAGGGNWDNTTSDWSTTSGGSSNSAWTSNGNATFQGTAGGTVNINASTVNVGSATFNSGAGPFTISNAFDLEVTGSGFADNATSSENVNNALGTIDFNGASSASFGSASLQYTNTGFITFSGTSTAGNATINNSGDLTFNGKSLGGTSSIANSSSMDISGLTVAGLTVGSLNNSGSVDLGTGTGGAGKTLTATTLTLDGGSEYDFTLGTTSSLVTASTVTNNATPGNPVAIDIEAGSGFGASTYTLIHDGGGTLTLADFSAGTVPAGYSLQLGNGSHDLDFVAVVPEPGTIASLLGGLALVVGLRRRSGRI